MLKILTIASTIAAVSAAACEGLDDCKTCLENDYCGWCSPSPVIFDSGKTGTRCADIRVKGWVCDNLYQTTQCVQGYVCDPVAGQCKQTTPGEGDTKANCEKACKKVEYFKCNFGNATCSSCDDPNSPGCQKFDKEADCSKGCASPPELYQCDAASRTCSACPQSYCTTDKQCPGSYCDIKGAGPWTCHGSTCSQKDKCTSSCGLNPLLVGIWRGVQIDADYKAGEFTWDIHEDGSVIIEEPDATKTDGKITEAINNKLVISTGGFSYNVTWKAWEPTAETEQVAFSWAPAGAAEPASTSKAMNGGGYDVYAMQKCKEQVGPQCNFSKALDVTAQRPVRVITAADRNLRGDDLGFTPIDHCNSNMHCSTCLNDPSGLCGWCDTPVVYADGQKGAQCAGVNSHGKADPSWICNVRYRKDSCEDYTCDFSDPGNPTCKQLPDGQPGISKQKCESGCQIPNGLYKCNNATFTCDKCDVEYCTTDKDCPNSYCQIDTSKPGPYICHGGMPDGCSSAGSCNATCSVPIIGVWRGIEVSNNFARGEWDFTADSTGTLMWRDPTGKVTSAQIHGGDQSAVSAGTAITLVSDSGEVLAFAVATTRKGIFALDKNGNENIVDMVTLAFSTTEQPTDFAMAMKDSEFVLLACDETSVTCSFDKSKVVPSLGM